MCSTSSKPLKNFAPPAARPNVRPSAVLFCGTRSRFGLAHLLPVLDTFDVRAAVFATDKRWQEFETRLSGQQSWRTKGVRHAAYEYRLRLKQILVESRLRSDLKRRRVEVLQTF